MISRHAKAAAAVDGLKRAGISEAFMRVLPDWLLHRSLVCFQTVAFKNTKSSDVSSTVGNRMATNSKWLRLLCASLFGPVFGLGCLVMPFAVYIEKDKPGRAAIIGAFIAVTGVIFLTLLAEA